MRNGDTAAAIEAYQKAIANKNRTLFFTKEPSAHNNLGQAYLQAGQFASAVASFKTAIEIAPGVAEGYVNLTTAYLRQNLLADARQLCLRALEMFPEVALLHYNLACAYALEADVPKGSGFTHTRSGVEPDAQIPCAGGICAESDCPAASLIIFPSLGDNRHWTKLVLDSRLYHNALSAPANSCREKTD